MQLQMQHRPIAPTEPLAGVAIPPLDAFMADHAQGFDPSAGLPRGRILTLPVLDSIDDLPLDLAVSIGTRPAVLVFYQGGWSRPCNAALRAFQSALPAFEVAGATVVAITPELPVHARDTASGNGVTFLVAVDHCCRFAKSLGIVFKLPTELRRVARDLGGVRLKRWNGEGSYDLPMPTVVILDRERRIRSVSWAFRTSDLDPERALAALWRFAGR